MIPSPGYDATIKQKADAKTSRIPIRIVPVGEALKKPDWIRVKAGSPSSRFYEIKQILREHKLHTVCEEASCPNIGECFGNGTATFMIMGDKCTRRCPFCDVGHGRPGPARRRRAAQPRQDDRGAEAEVRRHHQRRPRRPARRRRRPFRRLHREDPRALAGDADRDPDARLPRPDGPRARDPQGGAARRDEPQPRDRAAPLQGSAPGLRLRVLAQPAEALQGIRARRADQERAHGRPGRDRRRDPAGDARHARPSTSTC